jgi:hypothetical protein
MIDELGIGRRYRVTLKEPACPGWLEGVLRSARVPAGFLGNDDGAHSLWLVGETFEWFLRPDEIETIEDLTEASQESAPWLPASALRNKRLHPVRLDATMGASRRTGLDALAGMSHHQSRRRRDGRARS